MGEPLTPNQGFAPGGRSACGASSSVGRIEQRCKAEYCAQRLASFQNPVRQNYRHIRELRDLLELRERQVHNLVAFVGDATAKTPLPGNVVWSVCDLIRYISSKRAEILSEDEFGTTIARLADPDLRSTLRTRRKHVRELNRRLKTPATVLPAARVVARP